MNKISFLLVCISVLWSVSLNAQQENKPLKILKGHQKEVTDLVFSPDGRFMASASWDNNVYIWEVMKVAIVDSLTAHNSAVFAVDWSADGKYIASAGWDLKICIWNARTYELEMTLEGNSARITDLAFTPNGKRIASASEDGVIMLWDLSTKGMISEFKSEEKSVVSIDFSSDGKKIISSGWSKDIRMWDLDSNACTSVFQAHLRGVNDVCFNPEDNLLLSASEDNTAKLWMVDSAKVLSTLKRHKSAITAAVFSPNGEYLCTADKQGQIIVWDTYKAQAVDVKRNAHQGQINVLTFSPDGEYLLSAGKDMEIKLWDMSDWVYMDCMKGKMDAKKYLTKPKGEFETTVEYDARIKEYDNYKYEVKKDCRKEAFERIKAEEKMREEEIIRSYSYVYFTIDAISKYDADNKNYEITVRDETYNINMEIEDAKVFKETWQKSKVRAIHRTRFGMDEYLNLQFKNPNNQKLYLLGPQTGVNDDRYLREFFKRNGE